MDDFANRLGAMVRDAIAVVPDDGSVNFVGASGTTNADLYEKLLMFCSREINIALLGNNQSVEKDANKASATAAGEVEKDLQDDDSQMVADGINQWVRDFYAVNFPGAEPPVFKFWRQEQVDDLRAKRDLILSQAGAKFTNAYWLRTYNLEDGDLQEPTALVTPNPALASFADGFNPDPSQAALDDAIDLLDEAAIDAAMRKMLQPALDAIAKAATPQEVKEALLDAWPALDESALPELMQRAFFVADLAGMDSAKGPA
ncbi:MAG: DUF935 domain-containing protein [Desulfobulbus sp.]|nr:DUF935 domain-containing protein [Desulfobulbus sp.]